MPRVRGNIPNLVNGISQQAPALRLPSQAEATLNTIPLVVDGLLKRPPTQHMGKLSSAFAGTPFFHIIMRDDDERYIVSIDEDSTLRVHEFDGTAKGVVNNGANYLSGITTPKDDLVALTVIDHTFIVNKQKVVAQGEATQDARPYEGIVNVRAGNYAKNYKIFINGNEEALFKTPDGDVANQGIQVGTTYIADQLWTDLEAAGFNTAPWSIARYDNVIYIRNTDEDFTLDCSDDYANNAMIAIKDKAKKFSDLPDHNAQGFTVLVAGPDGAPEDDYWVKFEWTGEYGSQGLYRETVKPGAKLGVAASTMPHLLIRKANGGFEFKAAEWENRKCGDEESVPDPSFVGTKITDIILHRRRLGILTEDNCVLSETSRYYQFFRSTLTALLDTDPVDVAAAHTKVTKINHAVPLQDFLLLFSDETQFRLAGDETLTPKTVSIRPLTEMEMSRVVRPVTAGPNLLYIAESNSWAHLYEYYVDKAAESAEPVSVSSHAPVFVPAPCRFMTVSAHLSTAVIYSEGDPGALYVYNWYINDRQKLQSAWSRWELPGVSSVHAMAFDDSWLVLVTKRGSSFYVERMNLEQGQKENFHLDGRIHFAPSFYDVATNRTVLVTPYLNIAGSKVVSTGAGNIPFGTEMENVYPEIGAISGSIWYLEGDQTGEEFYFGFEYDSFYEFSEFFFRDGQSNERLAVPDGRLQVLSLSLTYANSAYFKVEVEPEGRSKRTYEFSGYVAGDPSSKVGEFVKDNGRFVVPIWSRSDRVKITVRNDTWKPFALNNAQWRGIFSPHSRQL